MNYASAASLTNQRLDIARRFILQGSSEDTQWMGPAYENAALFHLQSAVNGLLQEIIQGYQLGVSIRYADVLLHAKKRGIVLPVLTELENLLAQPTSWLCQLNKAYDACFECHSAMPIAGASNIIVSGGDAGAATQYYLNSLTDLVLRFREESAEY